MTNLAGTDGFEPPTSTFRGLRSTAELSACEIVGGGVRSRAVFMGFKGPLAHPERTPVRFFTGSAGLQQYRSSRTFTSWAFSSSVPDRLHVVIDTVESHFKPKSTFTTATEPR